MEQGQPSAAVYPRPPPFYQHFTSNNIARLEEIRRAQEQEKDDVCGEMPTSKNRDVPNDLRFLLPPSLPMDGVYRNFGQLRNINDTAPRLPDGIEQLIPSNLSQADRPAQLLRISRSLLLNFLELVGTMSLDPKYALPKVDDLRTLFFNAHELMNQYRPHQARETLIMTMQAQLQKKRDEIDGVANMKEQVESLLASLGETGREAITEPQEARKPDAVDEVVIQRREQQRQIWSVLNTIKI